MPIVANVGLFGTMTRTRVLVAIRMLGETHAAELARLLEISLHQAQHAVGTLERAGFVLGIREGVERRLRLNPRNPLHSELLPLLDKMGRLDLALQDRLASIRRRPRRAGKSL